MRDVKLSSNQKRTPKVDIRLDYENLHITLNRHRGWRPHAPQFYEAIEKAIADLGPITDTTAYADWYRLEGPGKPDLARGLKWQLAYTRLGFQTRLLLNEPGLKDVDTQIDEDINEQLRLATLARLRMIVVLGASDGDYVRTVRRTYNYGQRIVVLGIEGNISRDLIREAGTRNIRYLDPYLC
jgi:uncharacterized LabA/DUF88 family protein